MLEDRPRDQVGCANCQRSRLDHEDHLQASRTKFGSANGFKRRFLLNSAAFGQIYSFPSNTIYWQTNTVDGYRLHDGPLLPNKQAGLMAT